MAEKVKRGELFSMVDGKRQDAHLHAEILGDDDLFAYDIEDLPDGELTEEDFDAARRKYAERRRG